MQEEWIRMAEQNDSRREFLKKLGYAAPVVLTFKAMPALARAGSLKGNEGLGNGEDAPPPGHEINQNDEPAVPGEPQSNPN
jgi:hypothetical protein